MPTKTITIKTDEENPESVEIIADAIIKIADAFDKIEKSKLQRRALILLIQDNCGAVGQRFNKKKPNATQINEILDSIATLKKAYIKEAKK